MKLIIHDLDAMSFEKIVPSPIEEMMIISDDKTITPCIGCFGCWVQTPAVCILKDQYNNMGASISKCNEVIIISQCCYGGFSPFVKNVLDRSLSYVHPYFVIRNGEMHHKRRYENQVELQVLFYGETLPEIEKQTAQRLVYANSINLDWTVRQIVFKNNVSDLEGKIL